MGTYENKYKEALDRAKNIYGASECKDIWCTLETIFPEIKESESDRMRKGIIEELVLLIDGIIVIDNQSIKRKHKLYEYIDWLKSIEDRVQPQPKQEWSEEDEKYYQGCLNLMRLSLESKPYPYYNDYLWLKSIKDRVQPKQEWSEEDEYKKNDAITAIDLIMTDSYKESHPNLYKAFGEAKDWLKSLKERYTWKPTEEQMKALDNARHSNPFNVHVLDTLFHDLKKLREE